MNIMNKTVGEIFDPQLFFSDKIEITLELQTVEQKHRLNASDKFPKLWKITIFSKMETKK